MLRTQPANLGSARPFQRADFRRPGGNPRARASQLDADVLADWPGRLSASGGLAIGLGTALGACLTFVDVPDVELLWWEGCPSTERALSDLRAALEDAGLGDTEIRMTEIVTDEDARGAGFVGSPTILIDGSDVAPPPAGEPAGLNCRIYRRRDGRISPTPDPQDLRDALEAATP
jgi:hypothetical protein